ncbi:MAG TPA: TRZ/ATZ family hydrolase, partial [Gammaproteobacteria bacterium]
MSIEPVDALICPRWTIRIEPRVVAEEGLALAIEAGRIVDVLPVAEAERRYAPRVRHERPRHVLLPGLVNAHTHAAMALFRGFADDLPFEGWLRDRIWPAEARWVGPE